MLVEEGKLNFMLFNIKSAIPCQCELPHSIAVCPGFEKVAHDQREDPVASSSRAILESSSGDDDGSVITSSLLK